MRVGHAVWSIWIAACAGAPSHRPARVVEAKVAEPEREEELSVASEPPSKRETRPLSVSALEGVWEGEGVQNDGQTWPVVVTLDAARIGRCATVDYPSIPCKAVFICTEVRENGELRGREKLTEGNRCIDDGIFAMHLDDQGRMDLAWEGGPVTARASLERKR